MRTLATIQRILSLEPIPGADAIERATVLGWQLVVKKNEFNVGDLCVYCEIDSLFPQTPEFEFLKNCNYRIRTQRMRGQISQGICFPVSVLPGLKEKTDWSNVRQDEVPAEGTDVTELMGIKKYEDPIPAELMGKMKGYMPVQIPKTDIYRVQTMVPIIEKYKGDDWYMTEKLDGESFTAYLLDGVFGVCSKEVDFIDTPESVHWNVARKLRLEELTRMHGHNIAIQGELIGPGIKGNKHKLNEKTVRWFNVFDIGKHSFFDFKDKTYFFACYGLKSVPVIDFSFKLPGTVPEIVNMSIGKSLLGEGLREGIIIAPLTEKVDMAGRVQIKVINPEFLIKHKC